MLTNYEVDQYLRDLGQVTREQDQIPLLRKLTEKSTVNDLRMFIRLIQKDLVNTFGKETSSGNLSLRKLMQVRSKSSTVSAPMPMKVSKPVTIFNPSSNGI